MGLRAGLPLRQLLPDVHHPLQRGRVGKGALLREEPEQVPRHPAAAWPRHLMREYLALHRILSLG